MGCGAAEATVLGFVCFVVINPCVLSANMFDFELHCYINFPILHLVLSSFSGLFVFVIACVFVCLEFQIIRFVISTFMPIFFIEIFFVLLTPPGLLARVNFKKSLQSVVYIQSSVRRWVVRSRLEREQQAATRIQSVFRMHRDRLGRILGFE